METEQIGSEIKRSNDLLQSALTILEDLEADREQKERAESDFHRARRLYEMAVARQTAVIRRNGEINV